jgi:hypothetical protein
MSPAEYPRPPLGWSLLAIALFVSLQSSGAGAAETAPSDGCRAINRGELDAGVAADAEVTRTFELQAGETVGFFNRGKVDLDLSIAAAAGAGRPRTARIASGAPPASFAPTSAGLYTFRLKTEQGEGAVAASCVAAVPEASAPAETTFLTRRADRLTAAEPDRARLRRSEPGLLTPGAKVPGVVKLDEASGARQLAFSVSVAELAAAAANNSAASSSILDFWFEGRYGSVESSLADTGENASLGVAYLGAQVKLRPEIMVGTIAQFDQTNDTDLEAHVHAKGAGWMVGPYASLQLSPGIYLDARAAWGLADNEVAAATGHETFATERQLVRGRLTGMRELGAWRFAPSVGLTYLEESQRDAALADKSVAQGRVDVLPQLSYRTHLDRDTFVEPRATVGMFWTFDDLNKLTAPGASSEDARLKAEAGVAIGTKDGASINATGGMEDGGAGAADVWSGRFQLNVPLK